MAGYEIRAGSSPAGPVARASALLTLYRDEAYTYVLDIDLDRFVAVDLPRDVEACGLTPDGTGIVLATNRRDTEKVCLYDLTTGRQDWYGDETDEATYFAALSPDGRVLAHLCSPRGLPAGHHIAVRLHDIATGRRDTLWSGPGGLARESALAWSPDGELLAVGMVSPDDWQIVHVVDHDGRTRATYRNSYIVGAPNAAWFSAHELGVVRPAHLFQLWSVNVRRRLRPRRLLATLRGIPDALRPDRMFVALPLTTYSVTGAVMRTRFDGTDAEPFVTYPPAGASRFDIL
jgi:hypothetical protein